MTKKELNAIRHAAYLEWAKGEEAGDLLKTTNIIMFPIYKISEGTKVKLVILTNIWQMNDNLLKENGFTENAKIEKLFTANRQTKTLSL